MLSFREVASAGAVDLSVKVGALRLRNPILAASGTFGYGLEFAHLVDLNRLGGFVTKGLSRRARRGPLGLNPSPLVRDLGFIARAAEEGGGDPMRGATTSPEMPLPFRPGTPFWEKKPGGLGPPAIKPITLRLVWETRKA